MKNLVVRLRINSAKNLAVRLRINSVKNLIRSMRCKTEILRLGPQNDIAIQPPSRGNDDDCCSYYYEPVNKIL